MDKGHSQILIFGKGKVNLRQLVIFNCQFASNKISPPVAVSRAFRDSGNNIQLEDSNIKAAVFLAAKTIHLNHIFLTREFGLSIEFTDQASAFVSDPAQSPHHLLEIKSGQGQPLRLVSFVEASLTSPRGTYQAVENGYFF